MAITLVSSSVTGSIADEHHPYAAHGPWLQVGNKQVLNLLLVFLSFLYVKGFSKNQSEVQNFYFELYYLLVS